MLSKWNNFRNRLSMSCYYVAAPLPNVAQELRKFAICIGGRNGSFHDPASKVVILRTTTENGQEDNGSGVFIIARRSLLGHR
jgi:hypothetical protein